MPSATEIALGAYEALPKEAKEDPRAKAERERRAAEDLRWDLARDTLAFSPLAEWFPGIAWDIMAFGAPGTSSQYQGSGREIYVSPEERTFTLWLDSTPRTIAQKGGVQVQYARWNEGLPVDFEGYWQGIDVNGPAEIGKLIEADDEYDRQRLDDGKRPRRRTP